MPFSIPLEKTSISFYENYDYILNTIKISEFFIYTKHQTAVLLV